MQHSFKNVFHFSGELFPTKPLHLCSTNSNLITVYYFPCTLKCWSYNLFSNHRSGKKNQFFSYSNFPSQRRQTKGILSFLLSQKGQRHRKNILQRLGQLFCSVKKTLSSCFCAKSFDKKECTGKIIPTEKSFAHLLMINCCKRHKEAASNFQLWINNLDLHT